MFESPVRATLTATPPPPRCSSPHLSCNCIVLSLNQYLQQLLKLKGKNRFPESSPRWLPADSWRLLWMAEHLQEVGGGVFEELIDGPSQHGARPLRRQQTSNFVFVEDNVHSQLCCRWHIPIYTNTKCLNIGSFSRLTVCVVFSNGSTLLHLKVFRCVPPCLYTAAMTDTFTLSFSF